MKRMTDFTLRVLETLNNIPKGKVATYGIIARMLGDKNLSRAVGNALHKNEDWKTYPCHRVVNSQGKLAEHFGMGGPLVQKERLESEGVVVKGMKVDLSKYLMEY